MNADMCISKESLYVIFIEYFKKQRKKNTRNKFAKKKSCGIKNVLIMCGYCSVLESNVQQRIQCVQ